MTRNLKALGLALLAAFALSALSASAASAEHIDHFTAEEETALLTGVSHNNVFQLGPDKFECTTSEFAATVNNGDTETTVDVEYTGTVKQTEGAHDHCTSTAGTVDIDMNSCGYILTGDTSQEDPTGPEGPDAVIWVECETEGDSIDITSSLGVTISVPAQTPTKGGVTYEEVGGKVNVNATATGITTTCAPSFFCGLGGIPTHANEAIYTGSVLMTGYKDNNPTPGVITPAEEGPEIDIGIETT